VYPTEGHGERDVMIALIDLAILIINDGLKFTSPANNCLITIYLEL